MVFKQHAAVSTARAFLSALGALLVSASLCRAQTPANPEAKAPDTLRFVVYGDTRDGHDIHRKLVARIMAANPDLILQTGDLVHRGSDESLWKIYDEITGEMRRKYPVYPAHGNHDIGGHGYEDRVTAPFTSGNKLYYSFDKGGCHFVAVDSFSPYNPDRAQYKWLEKDLAQARGKARHVFVYFHVPPYSIGSHGSDETEQRTLCPLFSRYGVRAVFNGHDHIYYRTKRDGVPYIVSGGGGAPLYPTDPSKGAIEGDKWQSVNHFLICDVVGDKVNVRAIRVDGTELDRFTLSAP
jgi:3',5'-cyclic AMP phosphodiesterase CpdA